MDMLWQSQFSLTVLSFRLRLLSTMYPTKAADNGAMLRIGRDFFWNMPSSRNACMPNIVATAWIHVRAQVNWNPRRRKIACKRHEA